MQDKLLTNAYHLNSTKSLLILLMRWNNNKWKVWW